MYFCYCIQDIHKDSDSEITLEDVKVWFFETEKLIRTTANLSLEVTSQQGINQLRYAAHHILPCYWDINKALACSSSLLSL
jgi:hypothetical protein